MRDVQDKCVFEQTGLGHMRHGATLTKRIAKKVGLNKKIDLAIVASKVLGVAHFPSQFAHRLRVDRLFKQVIQKRQVARGQLSPAAGDCAV